MKPTARLLGASLLAVGGIATQAQGPSPSGGKPAGSVTDQSNQDSKASGSKAEPGTVGATNNAAAKHRAGSKGVVTQGATGANEDQGNSH